MRARRQLLLAAVLALGALALAWPAPPVAPPASAQEERRGAFAASIELTGTIDPATESWIERALDDAVDDGAALAIVRLDTPGGLDTSMRAIVRAIIAAPLPVVVYVSPDGARAASAGMFITLAGDVAAMAPATNIGSATPVTLSGGDVDEVLGRKVRNDAAAYARALADAHGRNADLAERMVRDAENVPAREALARDLVDLVADDVPALLDALDGFRVRGPKAQTLRGTGELAVSAREMPFDVRVRQLLVNPTVAYLLLIGGVLLIGIELLGPGLIGPGLFGTVMLLLGLYGTAQLPVSAGGVLLLLLAIGFLAAETQVAGGVLGAAGAIALVFAGLLLFDTDSDAFRVAVPAAIAAGVLVAAIVLIAARKALSLRRRPPRGEATELVGREASVRVPFDPVGQVYVDGALWRAEATSADARPVVGDRVVVERVDGLTLHVRPLAEGPATSERPGPPDSAETPARPATGAGPTAPGQGATPARPATADRPTPPDRSAATDREEGSP